MSRHLMSGAWAPVCNTILEYEHYFLLSYLHATVDQANVPVPLAGSCYEGATRGQ